MKFSLTRDPTRGITELRSVLRDDRSGRDSPGPRNSSNHRRLRPDHAATTPSDDALNRAEGYMLCPTTRQSQRRNYINPRIPLSPAPG